MKTIKIIFLSLFFGLPFLVCGQQIGNYIANGSFEDWIDCNQPTMLYKVKNWGAVDSLSQTGTPFSYCNGLVPNQYNTIYQLPRTGNTFLGSTFFIASTTSPARYYIKNRLRNNLQNGVTYCVKFHVNIMGMSSCGNDAFGIYFGDSSIDTITKCLIPLSYLVPQVKCPTGVPVIDTLGWTAITGTFVANGNEKYAIIGIFVQDTMIDTAVTNPASLPTIFTDACIDDVSCMPINLQAYAGSDKLIYLGDSAFIGRQPDFATDTGCVWYKLPNMTTSLDTISGIWVKPSVTSTYVVRQVLDCSSLKWDTVVVTVSTNYVGLDKLQILSDNINLFPNPTSVNLSISGFIASDIISFSISNCLGQNFLNGDIILKNNSIIIETSELESGLYQIHLKTQYGIVTKKFVKTN